MTEALVEAPCGAQAELTSKSYPPMYNNHLSEMSVDASNPLKQSIEMYNSQASEIKRVLVTRYYVDRNQACGENTRP